MTRYIAIQAKKLGKQYRIGQREQYKTLRDEIAAAAKAPFCRIKDRLSSNNGNNDQSFVWALKDVSFEVEQGEVVGIIGRNGSGKSTLLKILSRITTPTEGTAEIHGRVGSLLEVGTGFHPELTGRENIFLSGSVLGMRKHEIDDKFDEIVKFSEMEKFLDTPVKRYSSGMYVRLAFAVAAHLDPEILMVDEVLAVGDAAFQKKCLGKMGNIAKEGRTILFVSHNMNAVERLCNSCVRLEGGKLEIVSDDVRQVIKEYLHGSENTTSLSKWINNNNKYNDKWFKPLRLYIGDENGNEIAMPVSNNSEIWVYIEFQVEEINPNLSVGYAIYFEDDTLFYYSFQTDESDDKWIKLFNGINILRSRIPKRLLNEGNYRIELISNLHCRQWFCEPGINAPSIILTIQGGLSDSSRWISRRPGLLAPIIDWYIENGRNI